MIGSDMSVIVKTVVAVLLVPVMMYGFYVIVHGHLTPGGGFPGGAIIATMVTMFLVAYGKDISRKLAGREGLFAAAESVGLLLFGLVALIGLSFTFFSNFMANNKHVHLSRSCTIDGAEAATTNSNPQTRSNPQTAKTNSESDRESSNSESDRESSSTQPFKNRITTA